MAKNDILKLLYGSPSSPVSNSSAFFNSNKSAYITLDLSLQHTALFSLGAVETDSHNLIKIGITKTGKLVNIDLQNGSFVGFVELLTIDKLKPRMLNDKCYRIDVFRNGTVLELYTRTKETYEKWEELLRKFIIKDSKGYLSYNKISISSM